MCEKELGVLVDCELVMLKNVNEFLVGLRIWWGID